MTAYEQYVKQLPVIPEVARKVVNITEERIDISFGDLEELIMMDPGLTTKVLRVANSALYARPQEITNLRTAISLLGFKNIKSLVLLVTASTLTRDNRRCAFYRFFWQHAIMTALTARHIAKRLGMKERVEEAFLLALLHDIGQVALYNSAPEDYEEALEAAKNAGVRISETEQDVFGTTHKDVGARVFESWNFPDSFIDTAREHGSTNVTSKHKRLIMIVSVADFLVSNKDFYTENPLSLELIRDALASIGLAEDDLSYYTNEFLEEIHEDPMYKETKQIFNLA